MDVSEFLAYAGPLAWASGIVQAWEWVPVVPASTRSEFENWMRRQGYTTFRIFEKDGQGLAVDAGEREAYYPVAYLAPVAGNSSAMGFDLGSEAIRQAALQEALSSRLPTATASLSLVQETEQQKGIAIYHPILAAGSVRVSGFAVCVLRLQSALQVALVGANASEPTIRMRLLDLAASGEEATLAAFPSPEGEGVFRFELQRLLFPFFVFNNAWALEAHPTQGYRQAHRTWAWQATAAAMLLLTLGVAGIVGSARSRQDALEQKVRSRTRALRRQNAELDAVLENASAIMILVDEQVRVVRANHAAARLTGRGPDDLQGLLAGQAIACINACKGEGCGRNPECGSCRIRSAVVQAFRVNQDIRNLSARVRLDLHGTILERSIELSASPVIVEGTRWVLLTIDDVTERHAAEAALRDSETRYRIVADNTYNWEYWQSPEGMFLYVSPSCERISGIPAEDFMASAGSWERIIHPEDRHLWDAHRCRATEDRVAQEIELRIRRPDGEVRWIGHVCHPVFDDRGVFLGTRGGNRDITDRKRIEQELHRQARFLQVVIDAMPAPVVFKDQHGAYIGCNQAYLEFLGKAKSEIVGRTVYDLFPVNQAAEFQARTLQVLGSPGTLHYEARMRHADGADRDVIASLASFNDDQGRVSGLVGVVVDISERKRAEEALRQSQERLELVIAGTDAGLWDWEIQTGKVIFNARWAEMVGYRLEELEPVSIQTWYGLVHPEDRDRSSAQLERCFQREIDQYEVECRMRHKDGSWVWVQDRGRVVSWSPDGDPLRMAGTHIDISERKRTEAALAESAARYRAMFEEAGDGIIIRDMDFRYLDANPRLLSMLGYTLDEFRTLGNDDLVHPEDLAAYPREKVSERLRSGETVAIERRYRRKDGSCFPVQLSIRVVDPVHGIVQALVRDITARKQEEEELRARMVRLDRVARQQAAVASIAVSPLMSQGDVAGLAQALTRMAAEAMEVERVSVWWFQDEGRELRCLDAYEKSTAAHSWGTILGEEECRREFEIFKTAKYLAAAPDAHGDPRLSDGLRFRLKQRGIGSLLDATISLASKAIGVIGFAHVGGQGNGSPTKSRSPASWPIRSPWPRPTSTVAGRRRNW